MRTHEKRTKLLVGAVAALAAGIPLALGAGGVLLYLKGRAAVAAGTAQSIFTREIAAGFLKGFIAPALILALLIAAAALAKGRVRESRPSGAAEVRRNQSVCAWRGVPARGRALCLALIAALLAAGLLNGGCRDVFVKAIHICTECIGLG